MDSVPNTSIDPRHPLSFGKAETHGMAWIEGGFPHSEIRGSKPVRGSPRLIAAYHVLHRLSAPRHPPDTLMTLDRSHHRCPPGAQACASAGPAPTLGTAQNAMPGPPAGWTQDLCFRTCPNRGAVKAPRHPALPCAIRLTTKRRQDCFGPSDRAASACSRMPRGQTLRSDTFTLHDVEQHAQAKGRAMRQPAVPAANSSWCGRARRLGRGGSLHRRAPSPPEGDGGARRDRTDDLMLAKHALYRLSYCPVRQVPSRLAVVEA